MRAVKNDLLIPYGKVEESEGPRARQSLNMWKDLQSIPPSFHLALPQPRGVWTAGSLLNQRCPL